MMPTSRNSDAKDSTAEHPAIVLTSATLPDIMTFQDTPGQSIGLTNNGAERQQCLAVFRQMILKNEMPAVFSLLMCLPPEDITFLTHTNYVDGVEELSKLSIALHDYKVRLPPDKSVIETNVETARRTLLQNDPDSKLGLTQTIHDAHYADGYVPLTRQARTARLHSLAFGRVIGGATDFMPRALTTTMKAFLEANPGMILTFCEAANPFRPPRTKHAHVLDAIDLNCAELIPLIMSVDSPASLDTLTSMGLSALSGAVERFCGSELLGADVIKELLQHGFRFRQTPMERGPEYIVARGNKKLIAVFLDNGFTPEDFLNTVTGIPSLLTVLAAIKGRRPDLDACRNLWSPHHESKGETLLTYTLQQVVPNQGADSVETAVRMLLEQGASVNAPNAEGKTPLQLCEHSSYKIAELIRSAARKKSFAMHELDI